MNLLSDAVSMFVHVDKLPTACTSSSSRHEDCPWLMSWVKSLGLLEMSVAERQEYLADQKLVASQMGNGLVLVSPIQAQPS